MQAYRVKGHVDETGRLIVTEAIELAPGEVEVIVLQIPVHANPDDQSIHPQNNESGQKHISPILALRQLLENAPPISPDFDPEQAKWEYLKEKHDL